MAEADPSAAELLALLHRLSQASAGAGLGPEQRAELAASLHRLAAEIDPNAQAAGAPQPGRRERAARVYFDYALTGILETDACWRIQSANPAAASITGHDAKRLVGMALTDLPAPGSQARAERHLALLAEQGISQAEWQLRRRDERDISLEIASIMVDDDHYIHVIDDVSEQRQAAAKIERARAEAEAANRAKSEFLANISHEIRTPMNGILGLSRLALMTDLDPQQRDYLEKIAQSGRSLLQIINELLDYAKIEAGRMEFEHLPFALAELLDELTTTAAQLPAAEDLEVVFHLDPETSRQIVGDRLRLGQCLSNLLSNAIKFTPAGRVELRITPAETADGRHWLDFAILDTGIGMAPDFLARLFQPFSQADAGNSRRFGGTGLGLAITRELAEGMGGGLEVESHVGVGSRFTLRMPLRSAAEAVAPEPITAGTALVLCRRPATRDAARDLLAGLGWRASIADGEIDPGSPLFQAAAGNSPGFDLVIFDCADPVDDSGAVRGILGGSLARVPALVLTGAADGERCLALWEDHDRVTAATRPLGPNALRRALVRLGIGPAEAADTQAGDWIPQEYQGAHILVVEDNKVNQTVLLDLLHRAGIRTTLAQDGQEALDCMALLSAAPDLILMDVQMPGMDGLEATRALRRQGLALPIVGVSAGANKSEQAACLAAGMSDFLPKPIDQDELWGCLTRWLPPRNPDAAPETLPETAEARFLGHADSLARARQAFADHHAGDARDLLDLLKADDRRAMASRAHALKGAAATVGADSVAGLALELEAHLAEASPTEAVTDLIDRLGTALADTLSRH